MTSLDIRSTARQLIDVSTLSSELERFAAERNWDQFHSPKNLAMALSGEVGELTEIFQWQTEAASQDAGRNPATAQLVRDELADVLMYVVRLASVLGVNLNEAVDHKLASNAVRYPVDKSYGSSKKYDKM